MELGENETEGNGERGGETGTIETETTTTPLPCVPELWHQSDIGAFFCRLLAELHRFLEVRGLVLICVRKHLEQRNAYGEVLRLLGVCA